MERLFGCLSHPTFRSIPPNARTLVLMVHAALSAGDVARGGALVASLSAPPSQGGAGIPPGELYTVLQPGMLHTLGALGILSPGAVAEALTAPPSTPKWFFLKAAYEASRGDQFGSKHGAVLTVGGVALAWGRNHRYRAAGESHVRVMHSEVHCFTRLPTLEHARGGELWIVELDGQGLGYEEAIACVMCTKGSTRLGIARQHFSSHGGVKSLGVSHRAEVQCESLALALTRTYPEGTSNPDEGDVPGFDFSGAGGLVDPGRGREAMRGGGV